MFIPSRKYFYTTLIYISVLVCNSCKKETDAVITPETGTVTDIDNNTYKTIKIGNQWWMAENLKVKKFRNGTPIVLAQSENDWVNAEAAYCLYDDNNASPGLLYNWKTISDPNNIAPAGWHVPSDDEWKELEKQIGMSQAEADKLNWRGTNEGEKLKIEGREGWSDFEDVWPTNESGFTALAGGCRLFNGIWGNPGLFSTGFWWSSTSFSDDSAWYRYLDKKEKRVFRSRVTKSYGFSIRCVKDY